MALGKRCFRVGGYMSELITIKVLNWGKHQAGATRYDSTSWFKLKNSLISNEVWDCLNDAEFRFFIFLLCFISQKQHKTGIVSVHINTLNRISVIQKKTILTALDKLEELQIIECNHRAKTVQSPCENSAKAALEKRREEKRRSSQSD